ncbi:hypothetical protein CQW23_09508 [Capsicum baccatum]|uniref:Ubiquitin-like domain-containing protein n=1 Tax=Capsicum baccatum TaxID=33114 RepID=A0A2G2WX38_CAPBA|nr:hypothetical protein CQW23_09508 [Capsicum baccatum]
MTIYLKVIKTVALKVKESDSIGNVKALLHDKEGIPECLQKLVSKGVELRDEQKLVDYHIIKNSTLDAYVEDSVPKMLLVKRPFPEGTVTVYSRINDTIRDIKSRIGAKEKINMDTFSLFHENNFLEDDKTVGFYNIDSGSTIDMVFNPIHKLFISVVMPKPEIVKIEIYLASTVCDIKKIRGSKVGYSMDDMDLYLGNQRLEDSKKLLDQCNIEVDTIFQVKRKKIQILIKKWSGESIMLYVDRYELVENVKVMLVEKVGIPIDKKKLSYEGKILDDSRDLASYNIGWHSIVNSGWPKISTCWQGRQSGRSQFLQKMGSTWKRVRPVEEEKEKEESDSIGHVKALLHDKEGILVCLQQLLSGDNELVDGRKLVDYGICENSTLHANVEDSIPNIKLYVKRSYAEGIVAVISKMYITIQDIKSRILAKEGASSGKFSLFHDGKFLEDGNTLANLNIDDGSTLHMVFNPKDRGAANSVMNHSGDVKDSRANTGDQRSFKVLKKMALSTKWKRIVDEEEKEEEDIDRWNSWDNLANKFVQQFQYNMELISGKKSLTSMKKKNTESFRKYAIRWCEQAARVKPSMKEREIVEVFIQVQDETYYQHLLPALGKPFIEVLKIGEMIEDGIKTDCIMSFAILKATTQAIQKGSGSVGRKKNEEYVSSIIVGQQTRSRRPRRCYPQAQTQV